MCFSHTHYQAKPIRVTDQFEFWMGAIPGKLSCSQEQPVSKHHVCFPLFFHGKKPSNTHKTSLTKISFNVLPGIFASTAIFHKQNSSEKLLPFHANSKTEMFGEGIGFTLSYISHTSCRQKPDFIHILQYVDEDRMRGQASRLSHCDLFAVLFLVWFLFIFRRRSSVRGITLTRLTHIQKHRKITIFLPANVVEDGWWKAKQSCKHSRACSERAPPAPEGDGERGRPQRPRQPFPGLEQRAQSGAGPSRPGCAVTAVPTAGPKGTRGAEHRPRGLPARQPRAVAPGTQKGRGQPSPHRSPAPPLQPGAPHAPAPPGTPEPPPQPSQPCLPPARAI